jgi:photosystem II stability/assembly factor-like uncharacterized protein
MKRLALCVAALVLVASAAVLAAAVVQKGQWVNVSDALLADLKVKPGAYGPAAGIAIDRVSGDRFVLITDQGLYRAGAKDGTWARCDDKTISGRCETGFGIDVNPAGSGIAVFVVYGSSAITRDGGKTWTASKLSHVDAVSVDWTDAKTLLVLRHENAGTIALSTDGGATWKDVGKGFRGVGVFDAKNLVATKEKEPGIFRSTDGGQTWAKVSDLKPSGLAMRCFKNLGCWISDDGLVVSTDKGATWAVRGTAVKALQGPYFGKDESHVVVLTQEGVQETADGGKTWKLAAPLPPDFTGSNYERFSCLTWDPSADLFGLSRMTKPAYLFQR